MGLRELLDRIEPHVAPGARHEKWYALYEAIDTFFYRPASVTRTTAHVRDGIDLKRIKMCIRDRSTASPRGFAEVLVFTIQLPLVADVSDRGRSPAGRARSESCC